MLKDIHPHSHVHAIVGGNFFFDVMPRQVQAKAEKKKASKDPEKNGKTNSHVLDSAAAMIPQAPILASLNPLDVSEAIEQKEGEDQLCASCRSRSLNSLGTSHSNSSENLIRKSGSADSFHNSSSEGRLSDSPREEVEEVGEGGVLTRGDGSNGGEDGGEEYAWANRNGVISTNGELTKRRKLEEGMLRDGLDRAVCAS